jgi:hypothetical protein
MPRPVGRASRIIDVMAVPGRTAAAALLLSLDPPPWHLRHSRAVAEVAAWLAARVHARGVALDRRLVESAALLHDVDKALPAGAPERRLPHGAGSAAWLATRGYPELGPAVADHPVTRLADGMAFEAWMAAADPAALLVAYADKRAGQRLGSMADRFADWRRRYPTALEDQPGRRGWGVATDADVQRRAATLELRACELANVTPREVRRLAWTAAALRSAGTDR